MALQPSLVKPTAHDQTSATGVFAASEAMLTAFARSSIGHGSVRERALVPTTRFLHKPATLRRAYRRCEHYQSSLARCCGHRLEPVSSVINHRLVNPLLSAGTATELILPVCDVSHQHNSNICSIVFLHLKIIHASYHKTKTDAISPYRAVFRSLTSRETDASDAE